MTYPLIPLCDGERVYMTSTTLFTRKLEHIAANPQVSVVDHRPGRGRRCGRTATIQGDARVIDEDPHGGWERLLPIWEAKEPAIVAFLKVRVALPLFFERALIEIVPAPCPVWPDGDASDAPQIIELIEGGRVMRRDPRDSTRRCRPRQARRLPLPDRDLGG